MERFQRIGPRPARTGEAGPGLPHGIAGAKIPVQVVACLFPARPAPRHVPHPQRRDAITGARLKAEGVVAGVPDIFLAVPRQGFHGLYVELKRQKGGSLESSQEDIIARLRQAGYRVEVCMGWWEAREVIENYLTGALPQASGGRA